MANLHDCIQRAIDAKELDTTSGREIQNEFSQLVDRYSQAMPIHQAEATAAAHLKEASRAQQLSRRHKALNQLQTMVRIKQQIENAPILERSFKDLVFYTEGSGFEGESIHSLSAAYIKSINAGLNDVLTETSRNVFGNSRNLPLLEDLIRELHLEDTGNIQAKTMAGAVLHQQRRMRQMFNAHGGNIGELSDFGVAHSHDARRLRKVGFETWAAEIAPRLDWHRMIDHSTGKPFAIDGGKPDPARAREFLNDIYKGITENGWDAREPSMNIGGTALYNRRSEHRELHFKDGSNWIEYNKAFGTSDPFSAMIGGLHAMAREVAMMRVLGPNPKMGLEYAHQVATKKAAQIGNEKLVSKVDKAGKRARAMLAHFDGSANQAENEAWARFFSNTRKIITANKLGSAIASSVTDLATLGTAAKIMGLKPGNVFARSIKLMASNSTRETAARMGYVADTLADAGSMAARLTGDVVAGELAERLSGFTLRASGLSFWTDMHRVSFQMEFAGHLAENAPRGFDQIDQPLRSLFETRGITAADWDILRDPSTQFVDEKSGANFITPFHWLESQTTLHRNEAEGLAMRLQMAIEEQLEIAITNSSLEVRAAVLGESKPGSFSGEMARSFMHFKSFPLTLMMTHWRRFQSMPTPISKGVYAGQLFVGLTLLGAVAMQAKELIKGNDPRPMNRPEFWGGAVLQGGGLGIFGDFFSSATNRFGGGLAETLQGPVIGLVRDIAEPLASNAMRAVQGEDTSLGRDAASFFRYNTPVASSLWQTRVAYDRLVADQLQLFLDPEAEDQWRRQMRRKLKDYGTRAWWEKGQRRPHRAPDIGNVLGGDR